MDLSNNKYGLYEGKCNHRVPTPAQMFSFGSVPQITSHIACNTRNEVGNQARLANVTYKSGRRSQNLLHMIAIPMGRAKCNTEGAVFSIHATG